MRHSAPRTTETPINHAFKIASKFSLVSELESKLNKTRPTFEKLFFNLWNTSTLVTFLKNCKY